MPTPSGFPTSEDLQNAQKDIEHLGRVVNSEDAQGNPIASSTNRTGGTNKTLDTLQVEYQSAIQAAGGVPLGTWSSGVTYNAYNEYLVYNGIPYKPAASTPLPYTTQGADPTTAPDDAFVQPYMERDYGTVPAGVQIQHRRGTNSEIMAGVPAIAELWFNTTDNSIHMGDGVTQGGIKHLNVNILGDYSVLKFATMSYAINSTITLPVGTKVHIQERGATFVVTAGSTPFPLIDPQMVSQPSNYLKLLPLEGTSYSYSFLSAGGKNDLTISDENSDVAIQLVEKIMAESPIIGGTVYMPGGQYWFSKAVEIPGAKHITFCGEDSTLSYNTFESKTIIYSDNNLAGDYVFDFDQTQFMGIKDIGFRGDVNVVPTKGAFFLGKRGTFASGFGNAFVERVNVYRHLDGGLLKNCGISTIRDFQGSQNFGRALALETSGDSSLYNIYGNTNNKDTVDASLTVGVGLYIGQGSNNTNVTGGKLEFNSKGLVVDGSNGVSAFIQYDYNHMCNIIVSARNDTNEACRSVTLGGSRILSGGIVTGYEFAGIYTDSTFGSVSVNCVGGSLQAAGDGAYDNSGSGLVGPSVGIVANGNNTYPNEVLFEGQGTVMGSSKTAVARGQGTKVTIGGNIPTQLSYDEINGGSVITKQNFKQNFTPTLVGSSGGATYVGQSGEFCVIDGIAQANIYIELSAVNTLTGDLTISGIPFASKSDVAPSMIDGVINGIPNVTRISGFINPGENLITLWKIDASGGSSRLNASDITNVTLIRCSITYKV